MAAAGRRAAPRTRAGLARIFHVLGGTSHTLNGGAALPRRPELGRSSSFALPDYGICGLAWVVILFFCAAHYSFAAETNQVLDSWFSAQTNFHTFTGQVIQTRTLQVLSEPLVCTGKVWIAMPDRFRWEIGQPAQTIALRQPDCLFIIYPRLKRVEKYPLKDTQQGPWRDVLALLDASFPRSRAVMEAQFRVLAITQTNADWLVALQPRSTLARRMMGEIDICVRTNDFSLAATEMKFADGSRMRNDFTHIVLNSVLPEGCFDLKTEPDYTVVEPLKQ